MEGLERYQQVSNILFRKKQKKKLDYLDKEVMNLTGGMFPIKVIDNQPFSALKQKPKTEWVYAPLKTHSKNIGQLYSWVKKEQKDKLFFGQKFNQTTEFKKINKQQNKNWSYQEATYLFDLVRLFHSNFIAVADRYNFQGKSKSVQDIKQVNLYDQQYYSITKAILQSRNNNSHPLANYVFDKEYQNKRKRELEKALFRTKEINQQEKKLLEELKKLDSLIKKQEREQIHLKKALKLEQGQFQPQQNLDYIIKSKDNRGTSVYSRTQWMQRPLPLPQKVNTKLNDVLLGLNIPQRLDGHKYNEQLYDELRKKILMMFSTQKYLKKKQQQKKTFEQRKRKLFNQQRKQLQPKKRK